MPPQATSRHAYLGADVRVQRYPAYALLTRQQRLHLSSPYPLAQISRLLLGELAC